MFAEQVSHHPPITNYYFVGRGYKIYGSVGPQVGIRLNYVLGFNDKILIFELDGGRKIDFTVPTMVLNGMLFG